MRYIPIVFLNLVLTTNAYAYLDPGTGSYIIQVVLSMLFAGALAFRTPFIYLKNKFFKRKGKDD